MARKRHTPEQIIRKLREADPSVTPCSTSGTGYLYKFGLDCGEGRYTNPGGPDEERRTEVGFGMPSRPRASVGGLNGGGGGGGCNSKVTVITSKGEISNGRPGPLPGGGTRLRSWRER